MRLRTLFLLPQISPPEASNRRDAASARSATPNRTRPGRGKDGRESPPVCLLQCILSLRSIEIT